MNSFHPLALCLAFAALIPVAASPDVVTLPTGSHVLASRVSPLGSYALPVGVFGDGKVPVQVLEGQVDRKSWRLDGASQTTLQVLAPLRDQLSAAGFDIVFECRDLDCGGFDFRFGTEVISAPDMHVNIRDYRFLAAMRGDDESLGLLVSRAGNATYIQVIHTAATGQKPSVLTPKARPDQQIQPPVLDGMVDELQAVGHVVLADLVFETGSARLDKGPFVSLQQLAGFLKASPDQRIALVGHTDSVGSLVNNISLSKRRAESVRARMTDQYGIEPARIEAEGMGYLAPVASNLTREGRDANRRVEAILLSQ